MRFALIICFVFCFKFCGFTQRAISFSSQSILYEMPTDTICYKTIRFANIPSLFSPLTVAISVYDLNATLDSDYQFVPNLGTRTTSVSTENNIVSIGIIVRADNYQTEGDEQFVLKYVYDSLGSTKNITDTITIHDRNYNSRYSSDTSKFAMRIVTGSNFDFFDAPTFKNFAGDLNVFVPNLILSPFKSGILQRNIGLNLGIFNYRYYDADSSGNKRNTENYLLNPKNNIITPDSTLFIRENYYLNTKTTYNNWGLYLDPMIQLGKSNWYDLYLSLHFETIWRTQIATTTQTPVNKDTITFASSDRDNSRLIVNERKAVRPLYDKKSYFDKYVGIGMPLKVNIKKAFELFLYPSIGMALFKSTFYDTIQASRVNKFPAAYILERSKVGTYIYGLCKFQLTTTISPIDISLGGELRELWNKQTYLAMYLGAALSLDKLKK